MKPETDLESACRIICKFLANYKAKVYLFGSHARERAHRYSDIDVAVLPLQPVPPSVFAAMREAH